MTRANISVDKAVFDNFAAQAMLEGKTLYAFTNEWLDAAAKISAQSGKAKEVFELWRTNVILKQFDAIVLPSDFVDEMLVKLYATDKAALLSAFSDLGKQLVGILRIVAADIEALSDLAKDFTPFMPIKRFETRVVNAHLKELIIVGVGKRIESTECCLEFLKAVLNGYGYDVLSSELYPGTIRVKASRRSGDLGVRELRPFASEVSV